MHLNLECKVYALQDRNAALNRKIDEKDNAMPRLKVEILNTIIDEDKTQTEKQRVDVTIIAMDDTKLDFP